MNIKKDDIVVLLQNENEGWEREEGVVLDVDEYNKVVTVEIHRKYRKLYDDGLREVPMESEYIIKKCDIEKELKIKIMEEKIVKLTEEEIMFIYNAIEKTISPNVDPEGYEFGIILLYKLDNV